MTIGFFYNDTATTEIYTLSLHDALPILSLRLALGGGGGGFGGGGGGGFGGGAPSTDDDRGIDPAKPLRSEEHTSELQSQSNLVCRLLLEKKKHVYRLLAAGTELPLVLLA